MSDCLIVREGLTGKTLIIPAASSGIEADADGGLTCFLVGVGAEGRVIAIYDNLPQAVEALRRIAALERK